jgi:hypothetical protein
MVHYLKRKMIDLQHHHNNCTTLPHMGWGPVCGAHPHVRRCCVVVVVVLSRNQIPFEKLNLIKKDLKRVAFSLQ